MEDECSKGILCSAFCIFPNRLDSPGWSRNRKLGFAMGRQLARIGVEKSASHHLSHNETLQLPTRYPNEANWLEIAPLRLTTFALLY
jgi:hypothetical protein